MEQLLVLADAPEQLPEQGERVSRVQIAKTGTFKDPRYGTFSITRKDFSKWIGNFRTLIVDNGREGLPVDVDHSPEKRGTTEAAGWVKALDTLGQSGEEDTPDQLWATVEWNTLGQQLIEDRRYAYLSPSYQLNYTDETGRKHGTALVGIGLTNRPFLTMPTISLSAVDPFAHAIDTGGDAELLDWDGEVDAALDKLSTKERAGLSKSDFAIPEKAPGPGSYPIPDESHARDALSRVAQHGTSEEQSRVRAAVARKFPNIAREHSTEPPADSGAQMELTAVIDALSLDAESTEEQVIDKIKSLATAAPAEGQVVLSQDQVTKLVEDAQKGERALTELSDMRFETAFDKALDEARVSPAQKDSLKALYSKDADTVLALMKDSPQVASTEAKGGSGHGAEPATQTFDTTMPGTPVDEARMQLAADAEALASTEKIDFLDAVERLQRERGAA